MSMYRVTPAGAGTKTGATWANAMGEAEFKTSAAAVAAPGDTYFLAGGTYTVSGNYLGTTRDGAKESPIDIIGVKAGTTNEVPTLSDWAYGDDRPLIVCAFFWFRFADYWRINNLRYTCQSTISCTLYFGSAMFNCKVTQLETAGERGIYIGGNLCQLVSVEVASPSGPCIYGGGYYASVMGCHFHDSLNGALIGSGSFFANNVFSNLTDFGIDSSGYINHRMLNNTFYKCGIGVKATTAYCLTMLNNILKDNTIGAQWTSARYANFIDFNCWDNTTDVSLVQKGNNHITADPKLTDPDNGDFTLESSSPCLNAGADAVLAGAGV